MKLAQRCAPRIRPALFTRCRTRQISTASVDRLALPLATYVRVQTEVLSTTQADPPETFVRATHLGSVGHQAFKLRQGLFNLGDGSRAVDELSMGGVELGAPEAVEVRCKGVEAESMRGGRSVPSSAEDNGC